jgi:type IV secretion system protein TrbI
MDPSLTAPDESQPDPPSSSHETRAAVRDRRPFPPGALPRQLQTWIMVGLAALILGVILMTGRPDPGPVVPISPAAATTGLIPPARVRSYQDRLAEQETRLRQEAAAPVPGVMAPEVPVTPPPVPVDPVEEERRRREAQSLFADNVAFTLRIVTGRPIGNQGQSSVVPPVPITGAPAITPTLLPAPTDDATPSPKTLAAASVGPPALAAPHAGAASLETLSEGSVIEAVLVNRLDGTFQGPVQCLVTTPVYSHDRQAVVIPAGTRVLGSAAPVQAWGESRLALHFHRLLFPDGRSQSLESVPGLNQVGEAGLTDQVDRHYLQVFGASLAIGAIAGLAQVGTRGGFEPSFGDAARQSAGGSLATSTARVLDRYLNVLPTVTIREGHRIKVVLTKDLRLPVYRSATAQGGV